MCALLGLFVICCWYSWRCLMILYFVGSGYGVIGVICNIARPFHWLK
uniref:Uncharacterized protein n=1 Tax=Anguilla anguilla TaxID=7936 RepID=A0A0E9UTS7_ANGAN